MGGNSSLSGDGVTVQVHVAGAIGGRVSGVKRFWWVERGIEKEALWGQSGDHEL